jgi:hypothetical protein
MVSPFFIIGMLLVGGGDGVEETLGVGCNVVIDRLSSLFFVFLFCIYYKHQMETD